jgi:hypothetical protein
MSSSTIIALSHKINGYRNTTFTNPLPLQIRRRIRHDDRISIIIRKHRAQSPLRQILQSLISRANVKHIRTKSPIGPRLVDGVPLVFLPEIRIAEIVSLARRDEIETQRAVRAERACVGVPVEAAGRFGVASGLEFGHAWGVV